RARRGVVGGGHAASAGRSAHAARTGGRRTSASRRAAVLCRPEHRRGRRRARHFSRHRQAAVGDGARVAVPRAERSARMTPERRRRVAELFEAALDRDADSAAQWIAREAADDSLVRDEALSLLAHHSRAGAFLERPIAEAAPELLDDQEPLALGATVGAYTIVREIGRGGMGHVYLASD